MDADILVFAAPVVGIHVIGQFPSKKTATGRSVRGSLKSSLQTHEGGESTTFAGLYG